MLRFDLYSSLSTIYLQFLQTFSLQNKAWIYSTRCEIFMNCVLDRQFTSYAPRRETTIFSKKKYDKKTPISKNIWFPFFIFSTLNNSLPCFIKFWYFFAFVFCLVYTRLRELKKFDFLWKFDFLQNHSFECSLKKLICIKSGYEIFPYSIGA